jgi:hypothetical protein
MSQNQIGNNTTASTPFVTPGDVVYFQGTDNKLWRVNSDGTDQYQIGTNTTDSEPFVFTDPATGEDWIFFRGHSDNNLWKVKADSVGTGLLNIGGHKTKSTPFVTFDSSTGDVWVYFQSTDNNKLMKVKSDGTSGLNIGNNTTKSAPFVLADPTGEWVYFQGTDDRLLRVRSDGSEGSHIGGNWTKSTPFVTFDSSTGDVWVYFQGTDDRLLRVKSDGSDGSNIGGNHTKSTPFVTDDGWVWFQGEHDKLWRVFNDGSQQTQLGANTTSAMPTVGRIELADGQFGRWVYFRGTGTPPFSDYKLWRYFQAENPLATGTMRPKYYVLTVLYAPPGTNGGTSSSLVDYGSNSTTGTKTSTSSSFKEGVKVGIEPQKFGIGANFSVSGTATDSSSVEIKKSQSFDIKIPGPAKDGIDHDHDVFVLLLNPLLSVATFPDNNVQIAMGIDGPTMNIQYVYAGWLKDPSSMAVGVKRELDAAGLTPSDYSQILSTNPFASGSTLIDPNRFLATPQSFAYEPPFSDADQPWTETYALQNTVTSTSTRTVEVKYSVEVSVSGPLTTVASEILKINDSLEWTNTNSQETSSVSSESATVTVGGPSFSYTGPTDMLVYWDTVYHSFMFAFPVESTIAASISADTSGRRTAMPGHRIKASV